MLDAGQYVTIVGTILGPGVGSEGALCDPDDGRNFYNTMLAGTHKVGTCIRDYNYFWDAIFLYIKCANEEAGYLHICSYSDQLCNLSEDCYEFTTNECTDTLTVFNAV